MKKQLLLKSHRIIIPKRHSESKHNQYGGRARKGGVVCKECQHIYYKKSWMHPSSLKVWKHGMPWRRSICPACSMKMENLYEGEIIIFRVPSELQKSLLNLIHAFGTRAALRDSQHRLLEVNNKYDTFRVTTTENQLAVKLAKKIAEVFRGLILIRISHSKEPYEVDRVRLSFA